MLRIIGIFIGGGLGSVCRYALSAALTRKAGDAAVFPWGTFAVNAIGCLLIGLLAGCLMRRGADHLYLFAVTGFCGGFTTFSTFSNEAVGLLRQGAVGLALTYVIASVICGLIAAGAGYFLAKNF